MPMPDKRVAESPVASDSETTPADLSVVVLSDELEAPTPEMTEPETVAVIPNPAAIDVAPTVPEPQPLPPPPAVPEPPLPPTEPIAPEPPIAEPAPPATDLPPVDDAEISPAFEPPVDATGEAIANEPSVGPLVSYASTFPHFEGAENGCFGVTECRRVEQVGNYRSVARSLVANLEAQGYTIDLRDDLEDTGRNVYELLPPNETTLQYLLVFSDSDDGSAIYVMSHEILTLDELQSLHSQTESEPDVG